MIPRAPPIVLRTQAFPPQPSIHLGVYSDASMTHRATGLDPDFSPNPTRPLEPLDDRRWTKLEHQWNNTQYKAFEAHRPESDFPCPFCGIESTNKVISVDSTHKLCIFPGRGFPPGWALHLLCIPITQPGRGHLTNVADLDEIHVPLLKRMKEFAVRTLGEVLVANGLPLETQFFLQFHVPPFNSVDHLHMHISVVSQRPSEIGATTRADLPFDLMEYPPGAPRVQLGSPLHDALAEDLITDPDEISDIMSQARVSVVTRGPEVNESEHLLVSVDQLIERLEDGHGVCSALRERTLASGVKEYQVLLANRPLVR